MTVFDYSIIVLAILSVVVVLLFAVRTKKFLKTMLTSATIGLATLFILYFTSGLTGFKLELTPYTLGGSVIFGLPGVLCMVVAKIIFKI